MAQGRRHPPVSAGGFNDVAQPHLGATTGRPEAPAGVWGATDNSHAPRGSGSIPLHSRILDPRFIVCYSSHPQEVHSSFKISVSPAIRPSEKSNPPRTMLQPQPSVVASPRVTFEVPTTPRPSDSTTKLLAPVLLRFEPDGAAHGSYSVIFVLPLVELAPTHRLLKKSLSPRINTWSYSPSKHFDSRYQLKKFVVIPAPIPSLTM